ncbi:flagellar protein FlaG [Fervidobacterium pennivorans subsp. shakshaketiis]|uniref:Flagellar protein FlaG n=1 Tax=Fervidobacterium pennivorans (strain DSM 9078 / Ven5) TaxID=771875 RepID=H9UA08_FERPD|nr:flagellar protein FlaG [Fervidobacterium pennivorans]AFG34351.1 flagellar protein FlaG [Fervidobacterium pennivorans DSM 9078]
MDGVNGVKGVGIRSGIVEPDLLNKSHVAPNEQNGMVENVVRENTKASGELQNILGERKDEELEIFKENFEKLKKIFRGEAEFRIDKDTNMVVIKIKDPETGEVIRQIPPELAIKLAKNIQELLGVLMDERV